jgi:hypothetical protein
MKKIILGLVCVSLFVASCVKIQKTAIQNETEDAVIVPKIIFDYVKTVETNEQFLKEIEAINALSFGNYSITITRNFILENIVFASNANKTIKISGIADTRTITNNGDLPLFTVPERITLILGENIILDGNNKNAPLVLVNGGRLEMYEGAGLQNANNSGVIVGNRSYARESGGRFIMNGGIIQNNNSVTGGGVYVRPNARFRMNGGSIYGNSSSCEQFGGGGVFVYAGGTFRMNGGTISGNTSANNGGGVFVIITSIFIKNGGTIDVTNRAGRSGHVAYFYSEIESLVKKRDSAAGSNQNIEGPIAGEEGGWD